MKEVTDPEILKQLNAGSGQEVTDPAILAQLDGKQVPASLSDRWKSLASGVYRPTLEMGGMMLGGAAATPETFGLGTIPGAALGYAGGRQAANLLDQAIGLRKQQSLPKELWNAAKDVGFGAAMEMGGGITSKLLEKTAPAVRSALSRTSAGRIAGQEQAVTKMSRLSEVLGKPVPPPDVQRAMGKVAPSVDQLYDFFSRESLGVRIPVSNTLKSIDELMVKEEGVPGVLQNPAMKNLAQGLMQDFKAFGDAPNFIRIRNIMQRIGQRIGPLRNAASSNTEAAEELAALKHVLAGIHRDLDAVVEAGGTGSTAVNALRAANNAAKREFASEDMMEWTQFGKGIKEQVGQGDRTLSYVDPSYVLRQIDGKSGSMFRSAIPKAQLEEIRAVLQEMNRIPKLPPAGEFGSGRFWGRSGFGAALGMGGAVLSGHDPVRGGEMGVLAVNAGDWLIGKALLSAPGRKLMLKMMREQKSTSITQKLVLRLLSSGLTQVRQQDKDLDQ